MKASAKYDHLPNIPREEVILGQKAGLADGAVVFIGDSITEGLPIPPAPFPALNAGINGATAVTYHPFLGKLLDGLKAKIVIIALGVNDTLSDPRWFFDEYSAICKEVSATGARVVTATILPVANSSEHPEYELGSALVSVATIKQLNSYIAELSEREGYVLLDTHTAFADSTGSLPSAYTSDGVHLNKAGNEKLKQFYIDKVSSLHEPITARGIRNP